MIIMAELAGKIKGDLHMKKIGIVLIVIEIIAIFGGIVNGSIINMFTNMQNVTDICEILGFLIPGIIGLILLLKAKKTDNK